MILQYRKSILKLKVKFDLLAKDISKIDLLFEIQKDIVKYIRLLEKRIRKNKRAGKDLANLNDTLYIIKSFGDSIACIYYDSHNLKQLTFAIDRPNLKQKSGFISDKIGFQYEMNIMKKLISQGVPCLLCDITNSIRYGDILLLYGSDPKLIEIKKNKTKSSRNLRQKQVLDSLNQFYNTDQKKINYGLSEVRRVNIPFIPRKYENDINEIINKALIYGSASAQIENGLYYFVYTKNSEPETELIKYKKLRKPWIFFLRDYLKNEGWISYIPIICNIKNPENLIKFLLGDIIIMIIIDIKEVEKIANKLGLKLESDEDNLDYPFKFFSFQSGSKVANGMFSISSHYINRIPLEFLSLEDMIKISYELNQKIISVDTK